MPVGFAATGILFGITLSWGYPEGAEDALKTEIEYSLSADGTDAMLLSDVPHPQRNYTMQGLRAGQVFWFRARIVDKSGNQSPWIDWVRGMSSTETSAILEAIGDDFIKNSVAGQQLLNDDFMNAEAILETANANNASVRQQWEQYGENKAGILELWTTQANDARAFAEYQLLVTATFENQTAAIDQKMTAVVDADGASATYSLRAGLNYKGQFVSAGMVIGAEFVNGVAKSSIGFNADQLILLSGPTGNVFSPFAVVNGQVFMNDAFIAKASIGRGKITDTLESDNYVQELSGLKLDFKNGNAEFNNVTIRGTVYATAGKFSGTIESNDGYFGGTVYARKIIGDVVQGTHLKGYITSAGLISSSSSERVSSGVLWSVFTFDTADFDRVLVINGDVTWGNIYSGNDLGVYINGVSVLGFVTGGSSTPASTLGGVSFNIAARALGGRDVLSIRYTNFGGGSSNIPPYFNASIFICKKGSGGILVGPNNVAA
ncbi:putative phage host specificity protein [Yersinia frederiksenii]|nr:putative phage host specificity protein [Yersinia frederiksenii]